jgi:hypothetical protein
MSSSRRTCSSWSSSQYTQEDGPIEALEDSMVSSNRLYSTATVLRWPFDYCGDERRVGCQSNERWIPKRKLNDDSKVWVSWEYAPTRFSQISRWVMNQNVDGIQCQWLFLALSGILIFTAFISKKT